MSFVLIAFMTIFGSPVSGLRLLHDLSENLHQKKHSNGTKLLQSATASNYTVSIILSTGFVPSCRDGSTALVSMMIKSFNTYLDVAPYRKRLDIVYDFGYREHGNLSQRVAYGAALDRVCPIFQGDRCEVYGNKYLEERPPLGLYMSVRQALDAMTYEEVQYVLLTQHDLVFVRHTPVYKVIDAIASQRAVDGSLNGTIRFNFRKNEATKNNWDALAKQCWAQNNVKLLNETFLRTGAWSDRNHIATLEYYKEGLERLVPGSSKLMAKRGWMEAVMNGFCSEPRHCYTCNNFILFPEGSSPVVADLNGDSYLDFARENDVFAHQIDVDKLSTADLQKVTQFYQP